MRVLIVGGTGFIGSHVVDVLLEAGIEVVVFARRPERFRQPPRAAKYLFGDLADTAAVQRALVHGIDGVIHLASATVPDVSHRDPLADVANLVSFIRLLSLCERVGVGKVIFASSGGTVYGIPECLPIHEDHPTNPICPYGVTKLAMEKYLQSWAYQHRASAVILRLGNVYGPRQDPERSQGAMAIFTARALRGEPLTVWGDGSVVRDYVHVRDVARLFYLALCSPEAGVFNAGGGSGISVHDLLTLISAQLQRVPRIVHELPRRFDVPAVVLDCRKAQAAYSWQPQVRLADGIAEVADWLKHSTGTPARISTAAPFLSAI